MKLEELRGKDTFEARAVLEGLTVKELKEICKEHHRRGYSRYKKYQLVNELMMACCDEFLLSDLNGAKSESANTTEEKSATTQEEATMAKQTLKEAVNEAMETVAVMTSARDNNDNTRYVAMTKALKKYPLSVLKEVAARNNFNFKAYRLNKEEYVQELSNEIIRLLDFIDDDGREYQVTPLGAMRRDFLDGKMTYVESDVRDKSVLDFLHSLLSNRPDSQTLLDLFSCEFLYKWITCTPEPHAFRHLDEAQLRIMTGFRCRYNDRGIDSGMSIKIDLNAVEVRDSELAGKCFSEYLRNKFAREYERSIATKQAAPAKPEDDEITELKARVKSAHRKLVREGEYDTARAILRFLRKGETTLGLGDVSMEVEKVLSNVGCEMRYSASNYNVRVYLRLDANYARYVEEGYVQPWLYTEGSIKSAPLMKEQLAGKSSTTAEASTPETASVIGICAGVENYECGKLTKAELGEILSQAPAEALRKYILEVIADESGYELKQTA